MIFFLNHINSYTATHTKTNVPVPNSVSLSTKVDVHVSWSYPQNIFDDRKKDFRFTAFFLNSKIDLLRAYFFFEHITTTVFASYQNPVYLSDILWGWINVKIFELKRKKEKSFCFATGILGSRPSQLPETISAITFLVWLTNRNPCVYRIPRRSGGSRKAPKRPSTNARRNSVVNGGTVLSVQTTLFSGMFLKKVGIVIYFFNSYLFNHMH